MQLPEVWDYLDIVEEIGGGSFGTVYEALDVRSDEHCAVKVISIPSDDKELNYIKRAYGDGAATYVESMALKYQEEIKLLKVLDDNKRVVNIKDSFAVKRPDQISWQIFILMDLLEDLSEVRFTEDKVIQLGIDICDALIDCEKYDIIHRDIKPDNILMDHSGHFCLSDFGEARQVDAFGASSIKGTFSYMAPELYKGEKYGHQVDIYSLGLIMYQKLNHNREPLVDLDKKLVYFKDREEALTRRMQGEHLPKPVDASEALGEIILKACAFATDQRYQTASELKADLWQLKLGTYTMKSKKQRRGKDISYDKKQVIRKSAAITAGIMIAAVILMIAGAQAYKHLYFKSTGLPEGSSVNGAGVMKTDGRWTMAYLCSGLKAMDVNQLTKVIITEPVDEICDDMFRECSMLKTIEVSDMDQVTRIGSNAFQGCVSLKTLPSWTKIENIGNAAFYNCTSLEEIRFSESLQELGTYVCHGCTSLESVILPEGVVYIPEEAFSNCEKLKSISLPASLKRIYACAFDHCTALTEIDYPQGNHIEYIDESAFEGCVNLKEE